MAERSTLNQTVQIGVETTPGTSVAATKRLTSLSIEPSVSVEKDNFRPSGQKFQSLSILGKEWTEASLSGRATYTELQYVLSSVMNTPTITAGGAGNTGSYTWVFAPASTGDDTPKTFTVEHGSSVRADKFTYGLVTEFGMTFSRDSIEISGSMMGRALVDSITMTASPTVLALVPIIPTQVSVYLNDTFAAIGTTKLTRLISGDFNLGSRFGPVWVVDAANPSFITHIESEPDLSCTLTLQADAQGMALLTQLRDGATKYLRIEAIGALIPAQTTATYKFTLDLACKVSDTGGFSDADGVYAVEFSFIGVHDTTFGKAVSVTLVNDQAAL